MEEKAGIVVFASGYDKTGKMDKDLISRLKATLRLWKNKQDLAILVTGGTHHPTKDNVVAEDMRDWLITRGIPESQVFSERKSYNSWTNLVNSLSIIKGKRWTTVFLVSNKLHLIRIKFYIWRLKRKEAFLKDVVFVCRASEYLDLGDFIWETAAWIMPRFLKKKLKKKILQNRHLR